MWEASSEQVLGSGRKCTGKWIPSSGLVCLPSPRHGTGSGGGEGWGLILAPTRGGCRVGADLRPEPTSHGSSPPAPAAKSFLQPLCLLPEKLHVPPSYARRHTRARAHVLCAPTHACTPKATRNHASTLTRVCAHTPPRAHTSMRTRTRTRTDTRVHALVHTLRPCHGGGSSGLRPPQGGPHWGVLGLSSFSRCYGDAEGPRRWRGNGI